MGERGKAALAAWITAVWTFSVVAGQVTGDWIGAQVVSPVMLLMNGYYFGTEIAERLFRRKEKARNGSGA